MVAQTSSPVERLFAAQKAQQYEVAASSCRERKTKLLALKKAVEETFRQEIRDALYADFQKPQAETDLTEIFAVTSEINHTVKYLERWMSDRYVRTPLSFFGSSSYIRYQPKGVCLIISPWNFPLNLSLGPLISAKQKRRVETYIAEAGAPVLAQGRVAGNAPAGGFYVAPVLLGPVDPNSRIAQEEVFGPVLCAIPFDTEAEAIEIANGTEYGLVASVWTRDGGRQARVANAMRCGQVFINGYGAGGGVELPFGGIRKSGHGREKGFEALHEFSTIRTIVNHHG